MNLVVHLVSLLRGGSFLIFLFYHAGTRLTLKVLVEVVLDARHRVHVHDSRHALPHIDEMSNDFDVSHEGFEEYFVGVVEQLLEVAGHVALRDEVLVEEEAFSLPELLH